MKLKLHEFYWCETDVCEPELMRYDGGGFETFYGDRIPEHAVYVIAPAKPPRQIGSALRTLWRRVRWLVMVPIWWVRNKIPRRRPRVSLIVESITFGNEGGAAVEQLYGEVPAEVFGPNVIEGAAVFGRAELAPSARVEIGLRNVGRKAATASAALIGELISGRSTVLAMGAIDIEPGAIGVVRSHVREAFRPRRLVVSAAEARRA